MQEKWNMANGSNVLHWRRWTAFSVVLLATCAGAAYFLSRDPPHVAAQLPGAAIVPEPTNEVRVEVIRPRKGATDRTTSQPGSVQAFESVHLYSGVSGYLKTQTVDIGDRVKKGQVLAAVDVPDLQKQVQRAKAGLSQARARVKQMAAHVDSAKAELDAARTTIPQTEAVAKSKAAELRFRQKQLERMRDLFTLKSIDERLVDEKTEQRDAAREAEIGAKEAVFSAKARVAASQAKVVGAEADLDESKAEVEVAQAELEKAEVMVTFATIPAPFDGVVTARNHFVGDYIRAAREGASQVPLLTVQRTDLFRVVVQIPDRDVPYADVGDPAIVEIDAMPGQAFPSKISRLADSEDPQTRLMHIEIDLPNPTRKIRHGMYGRVTILLEKSNSLAIPSSCMVGKTQEGKASVYVVREGKAQLTPVQVGADNGLQVAIIAGLSPDSTVILHPSNAISNGTPVASVPERKSNANPGH
jgi:HlyD family secretion protein